MTPTCVVLKLALKGVLCTRLGQQRADYKGPVVLFLPDGYVMLMRPNKAETAVHGCHCPGDMALRRYWPDLGLVFECVTCFFVY